MVRGNLYFGYTVSGVFIQKLSLGSSRSLLDF